MPKNLLLKLEHFDLKPFGRSRPTGLVPNNICLSFVKVVELVVRTVVLLATWQLLERVVSTKFIDPKFRISRLGTNR